MASRIRRSAFTAAMTSILALAGGCGDSTPSAPSGGAVVTFQVVDETFRVALTQAEQVAAARAARDGGPARIPNGRVAFGGGRFCPWSAAILRIEEN
jgi:hypothetical protein